MELFLEDGAKGMGYRLYDAGDVAWLQRIISLRQLGFALDEIRECLHDPALSPLRVIKLHLARLDEQIERQRQLRDRLEAVAERMRAAEEVSAEEFIRAIEAITMFEKYYTPEQLEQLEARRKQFGEERIREVETEWPKLIAQVRAEMERGTDPADPWVRALARRWQELVEAFTGGDPGIEQSVRKVYQDEHDNVTQQHLGSVPDGAMFEYISRANASGKTG